MNDHAEIMPSTETLEERALVVDLERAQIDQMIATAHKYPRSLESFMKRVQMMALYNEAAAENCVYSLPRGGKPIIGPSIGFANIVATAWGNCVDGSRWVATDRKEKVVVAEGVFHDYETNRKVVISEQRRIVNSRGAIFTDDMIIVTSKAAGAIARRNAILQVIPRAMWYPIWEQALQLVRGTGETFAERKDKTVKAFAQFGVKPEQLWGLLEIKGEADLNLEHIPILRGAYAALRDGSTTVEEMFDPRKMSRGGFESMGSVLTEGDIDHDDTPPAAQQTRQSASGATQRPAQQQTAQQRPAAPQPQDNDDDDFPGDVAMSSDEPPPFDGPYTTTAPELEPDNGDAGSNPEDRGDASEDPAPSAPKRRGRPSKADKVASEPPAEEQQQAPAEQTAPPQPRTTEQYATYWQGVLAAATSATALEQRWKSPQERALRGNCSVIEDDLISLKEKTNNRIEALKAAGN